MNGRIGFRFAPWLLVSAIPFGTPIPAQQPSDAFPADFKGQVTYKGTHQGSLTMAPKPVRKMSIAERIRVSQGGSTQNFQGELNVELTFDEGKVSGRFWGTGGINSNSVVGTRVGSNCYLIDQSNGASIQAVCSATRFYSEAEEQNGRKTILSVLDARTLRTVNAREAVAEPRLIPRQSVQTSTAVAQASAPAVATSNEMPAAPNTAGKPAASATHSRALEAALSSDSAFWQGYKYDSGSFRNARIVGVLGDETTVQADYTYDGGKRGWLSGRIVGGKVYCIRYEEIDRCVPPRTQGAAAKASLAATTADQKCLAVVGTKRGWVNTETRNGYGDVVGYGGHQSDMITKQYQNTCSRPINVTNDCPFNFDPPFVLKPKEIREHTSVEGACSLKVM